MKKKIKKFLYSNFVGENLKVVKQISALKEWNVMWGYNWSVFNKEGKRKEDS